MCSFVGLGVICGDIGIGFHSGLVTRDLKG
jgi:hypothetical protein